MNLYKALMLEINEHKKFWNYYEEQYENILETEEGAENFIKKYFEVGSKACMVQFSDSEKMYIDLKSMGMRMVHTVNTFFIGVFLQRIIDENLAIKLREKDSFPFAYLWYLVCFAHDLGYAYENNSSAIIGRGDVDRVEMEKLIIKKQYVCDRIGKKVKRCVNSYSYIRDARRVWYGMCELDIEYAETGFGPQSMPVGRGQRNSIEFTDGTVIRRPWYNHRLKNNYFLYRLLEMNVIDHGIIGGDIFFSKMKKNYDQRNQFGTDEFWDYRGNYFCIEQRNVFAYIADCIISHNIFIANNETEKLYEKYELQELMPNDFKRISYRKNLLLFILCVADTLEPSKRFLDEKNGTRYTNRDLLQKISIDYNKVKNEVTVKISKELFDSDEGRKYKNDIETMEKWCEIKGKVEIQITK